MSSTAPTTPVTRRRAAAWVAGVGALLAVVAGVVALQVWPARMLRATEQALARDEPAAARATLDRYLAFWPNDRDALYLAAQAARRQDAYADAERFLTAAEGPAGPTAITRLEWALLGAQQGDFADNEERLKTLVSHDTEEAPFVVEALAKGYVADYRLPEALLTLDWLIGRRPQHVGARILRGRVRARQRQADVAEADLRRAVELAPQNAVAHAALAAVLVRLGHTREAIYHYERALAIDPTRAEARLGLARALADDSAVDEAVGQLEALLTAEPEHPDGLAERGRLALRRGQADAAVSFLDRAVAAAPWHRDAVRLHVQALRELGRGPERARAEERLAALRAEDALAGRLKLRAHADAGDVDARWQLWLWSQRNGAEAEGRAWLAEILRADPRHVPAHAALAEHFERAGQPRRAAMHREATGP